MLLNNKKQNSLLYCFNRNIRGICFVCFTAIGPVLSVLFRSSLLQYLAIIVATSYCPCSSLKYSYTCTNACTLLQKSHSVKQCTYIRASSHLCIACNGFVGMLAVCLVLKQKAWLSTFMMVCFW